MQALDIQWDAGALQLERALLKRDQVDCPVVHRFGPGIYIREVHMPAGATVIGHHHNQAHVNIALAGKLRLLNADGSSRIIEAPHFEVMPAGRKVAYILEDTVWQNIYSTDETDVEKLEAQFMTKSPVFVEEIQGLDTLKRTVDRDDFKAAISEMGWLEHDVREISVSTHDICEMPSSYAVQLGDSGIEGKGLFATAPFKIGDVIAPARIAGKRTIAGRYTNHAKEPNATAVLYASGDIAFVAIQDIQGNRGGELGDEITVDYRQVLAINEVSPCQE